jgi:hypothetical protein
MESQKHQKLYLKGIKRKTKCNMRVKQTKFEVPPYSSEYARISVHNMKIHFQDQSCRDFNITCLLR